MSGRRYLGIFFMFNNDMGFGIRRVNMGRLNWE
jgi:hypothetical protein